MTMWSRPDRDKGSPLLWALSAALAKRAFGRVVLSTDSAGARWAEKYGLPFDEVRVQLDGLEDLYPVFAAGKLRTYELLTEPAIHVDGDALLWSRPPAAFLAGDMFAQNREVLTAPKYVSPYGMGYRVPLLRAMNPPPLVREYLDRPVLHAHNFGVVGFNDLELAHEYAGDSLRLIKKNASRLVSVCSIESSMLVEQLMATPYAERRGIELATLLPEDCSESAAVEVGYTHLIGDRKHEPENLRKVKAKLEALFPELHERVTHSTHPTHPIHPRGSKKKPAARPPEPAYIAGQLVEA